MNEGQQEYFVVLDDAKQGQCRYYQNWVRFDAIDAANLNSIDERLAQGWAQGWHVVLWQSYDFGVDLVLGGGESAMYLLWFEQCDVVDAKDACLPWQELNLDAGLVSLHNEITQPDYLQRIEDIHAAIGRGEVYQINYTTPWHGHAYGNPLALYARLRARQQVSYGVLAHVPCEVNNGAAWHLGFSPELFLRLDADAVVLTQPMKGTAPILGDGLDESRAEFLRNDAKNRAENVMIVDLLRNDLGKLARVGGVSVPSAFDVTAFGSVWQMTSTVKAHMRPETTVADVIRASFPCGSITGAPKHMAMQVIANLEQQKRGLYTGSVGYLQPCDGGIGFSGAWNVVIRSLNLTHTTVSGRFKVEMGIGSGIVIDSVPEDEWDECLWKARFAKGLPSAVGVMETLRVENGVCEMLALHQKRLLNSVRDLQIECDLDALWQALQDACMSTWAQGLWRVKCLVSGDGQFGWEGAPLQDLNQTQTVSVSKVVLPNQDVLRRYKTTQRQLFDSVWQKAVQEGCFDALLFNQNGCLLEGGRSNVFVEVGGVWYTPSLNLDILNGVMRQAVLQRPEFYGFENGIVECDCISQEMLQAASTIRLSNALRGLFEVKMVGLY